jgi:hypothetical protein
MMLSMMKQAFMILLIFCAVMLAVKSGWQQSAGAAVAPGPDATPSLAPLEELSAPVALYPDALLAQSLTSATSPQQVIEITRWLRQNTRLKGTELRDAASRQGFDVSFVALAQFPDVLNMMAAHIDWTEELGTAFLSDPKGVLDSVQSLRARARAAGNLKSTRRQTITVEKAAGRQMIAIHPANPQVVYIPVYNPQIVYWPATVVADRRAAGAASALIAFGSGIAIGTSIVSNSNDPPFGWGAWSISWHSRKVLVRGGTWVVPADARYPYVRPIPTAAGAYLPRPTVHAPANINVNATASAYAARIVRPRAVALLAAPARVTVARPAWQAPQVAAARSGGIADYAARGYSPGAPKILPTAERAQTSSSAFSGYQSAGAEQAASTRGRSSMSASVVR